jgi:hypothetical protein
MARCRRNLRLRDLGVLALIGPASLSCWVTRDAGPANAHGALPVRAAPVRAWDVVDPGGGGGYVVEFRDQSDEARSFFSVRNREQQELGLIDGLGRAWRYRPHQEPEWVGTGTVLAGASVILGLGNEARMEEVALGPAGG